jgi:hypothetical protein
MSRMPKAQANPPLRGSGPPSMAHNVPHESYTPSSLPSAFSATRPVSLPPHCPCKPPPRFGER